MEKKTSVDGIMFCPKFNSEHGFSPLKCEVVAGPGIGMLRGFRANLGEVNSEISATCTATP